jgi:hypothetical protein
MRHGNEVARDYLWRTVRAAAEKAVHARRDADKRKPPAWATVAVN